jgi:hypothetical protein
MNISVPISYSFTPQGKAPLAGGYTEGTDSWSIKTDFDFYEKVTVGVGYTDYLHSGRENPKADRDMLSIYVKYSF